jgi:hypothetical protein
MNCGFVGRAGRSAPLSIAAASEHEVLRLLALSLEREQPWFLGQARRLLSRDRSNGPRLAPGPSEFSSGGFGLRMG